MNRNRFVIVFDFETDSKIAEQANIVQIGAVGLDLRNNEIDYSTELNIKVCPNDINKKDYYETHADTINWHANLQNKNVSEILDDWRDGMKEKDAWLEFINYCKDLSPSTSYASMPIAAGHNVRNFDIPICKQYKKRYNTRYPFVKRDVFDSMELMLPVAMFSNNPPQDLQLPTLCEFFGLGQENLHDALFDVRQTAQIIQRFLGFYQYVIPKVKAFNYETATI